jgi:hypothetical protein
MHDERDRTGRSARASAPTFPPEVTFARSPRRSHPDSSYIARRRDPSAPAYEVDLDEIELVDNEPWRDYFEELASPAEPPQSQQRQRSSLPPHLPEVAPSAVPARPPSQEARPSQAPFPVPLTARSVPPQRRLLRALAYSSLAISLGTAVAVVKQPHPRHVAPVVTTTAAAVDPPPPPAPTAAPSAPASVPVVEVAALPRPHDGEVVGSPGHRLWVDGSLVTGWRATVPCGSHMVQVGSAGASRSVDVRCGESIMVSP